MKIGMPWKICWRCKREKPPYSTLDSLVVETRLLLDAQASK